MSDAHDQVRALAWASPRSSWLPADVIVQAANGLLLVTLLVFAARVASVAIYVALHVLLAAISVALVRSDPAARSCDGSRAAALYFAFPAIGPHRLFDGQRLVALDGYGLAGRAYAILCALPLEPPDAFPSGHTLIGVLVPALAWRTSRPLFLVLCPLGLGIVLATIYLRFHYVADVLAGLALAPIAWKLGSIIDRRWASSARSPTCVHAPPKSGRAVGAQSASSSSNAGSLLLARSLKVRPSWTSKRPTEVLREGRAGFRNRVQQPTRHAGGLRKGRGSPVRYLLSRIAVKLRLLFSSS